MKTIEPKTKIIRWTSEEYREYQENEVQAEFGMTVDEFTAKFYDGTLNIYAMGVASTATLLCLKLN